MKIDALNIPGSFVFTLPVHGDTRGSFENHFPKDLLNTPNVNFDIQQVNISRNLLKGTLRGLHFQTSPYAESKIVSCLVGEVFDVIVDLRPESRHFGTWESVHLTPSFNSILVPPGVAHGFQTLTDNSVLQYLHSGKYSKSHSAGVRYDDPALQISWPLETSIVSSEDLKLPTFIDMKDQL